MRKLKTEILIIGGGATGIGTVRDLAMRGFKTILVEQGDLATGTTGRHHGLLHSGGRYVVKDPVAAKECIEENRILRRIMPECIEDTGGFFVLTPDDNPSYVDIFIKGCEESGIPCEEISITNMLHAEPLLNPHITRCIRVPDASADPFLAADMNARSAAHYGANILRYHQIQRLLTSDEVGPNYGVVPTRDSPSVVCGALCHDLINDEDVRIEADLVVNATGAWAGKIAATAGIQVQMTPGKGILLAVNHRIVNTVINRCKIPGDGDIIVPAHTVAVIGTTDVKVPDPDHFGIETWEVQLMLDEGEKLIPGFQNLRFLRAWAGVRPLYQENSTQKSKDIAGNREITRAFVLLDHAVRDGVNGFMTITGGKWTTYRKMAQVTADKVCEKLGVIRECRTHIEALPMISRQTSLNSKRILRSISQNKHHTLGHRLAKIEADHAYGKLICECELATREDVVNAILDGNAQTLDDIRRDIRLGMGPCQAGFCTLRAAGLLHQIKNYQPQISETKSPSHENRQMIHVCNTNMALLDFLQERWKGVKPILWGQQLRQERLNELIYLNVLNADHLPIHAKSRLSPSEYEHEFEVKKTKLIVENTPEYQPLIDIPLKEITSRTSDILIIGAGLAGLTTAYQAAIKGKKPKVITKGWGTTHWATGCVDVLGYYPPVQSKAIESPADAIKILVDENPHHPYAIAGLDSIEAAIRNLQDISRKAGYPLQGSLNQNWMLPTAIGALRPTCLAPNTMVAGDCRKHEPTLIVGFEQLLDFYPALVADNLTAQNYNASGIFLDLPSLKEHRYVNSMYLARLFDKPEFRTEVIKALKLKIKNWARIGFPSVLGLYHSMDVLDDLQTQLDCEIFEIPGLPPSVPGIRMHNLLTQAIHNAGGNIFEGMQVTGAYGRDNHLQAVVTEASTRQTIHQADNFVLATGGILGGGIAVSQPGYTQNILSETALGLPIHTQLDRRYWFKQKFLDAQGHPVCTMGLSVNSEFQPLDSKGRIYYDNLFAIGGTLGNCDPIRECSLDGVAIVTGWAVIESQLLIDSRR